MAAVTGTALGDTGIKQRDREEAGEALQLSVMSTYKQRIISRYYWRGKVIHNGQTISWREDIVSYIITITRNIISQNRPLIDFLIQLGATSTISAGLPP